MTDKQIHEEVLKTKAMVKDIMKNRRFNKALINDDAWLDKMMIDICNVHDCWTYHRIVRQTIKEALV